MSSFAAVERYIMQTPAWRSLTPVERAAYLEYCYCYDGRNNGAIQMSARVMGDRLGMDKATASRAIRELILHGLIETARHSSFTLKLKLAAEYRLTAYTCDATGAMPSKAFLKWKPENQNTVAPMQLNGCALATEAQKRRRKQAEQLHPCNREASNPNSDGCTHAPLLYSNHVAAASMTVLPGAATPEASAPASVNRVPSEPDTWTDIHGAALKSLQELTDRIAPDCQSWAYQNFALPQPQQDAAA